MWLTLLLVKTLLILTSNKALPSPALKLAPPRTLLPLLVPVSSLVLQVLPVLVTPFISIMVLFSLLPFLVYLWSLYRHIHPSFIFLFLQNYFFFTSTHIYTQHFLFHNLYANIRVHFSNPISFSLFKRVSKSNFIILCIRRCLVSLQTFYFHSSMQS